MTNAFSKMLVCPDNYPSPKLSLREKNRIVVDMVAPQNGLGIDPLDGCSIHSGRGKNIKICLKGTHFLERLFWNYEEWRWDFLPEDKYYLLKKGLKDKEILYAVRFLTYN